MTYPIEQFFVIAMLSGRVFHASSDAGEADVVGVEITRSRGNSYSAFGEKYSQKNIWLEY